MDLFSPDLALTFLPGSSIVPRADALIPLMFRPSKLVNSLKGVSSRLLRKEFPELEKYYWKGGLWSPSYFIASCAGVPMDIVKEYIENQ